MLAWRNLRAWRRWTLRIAYVLMGVTVPVNLFLLFIQRDFTTSKISVAILAFVALWFAFVRIAPRVSSRRQFQSNPSAQPPMTIEVSDLGLTLNSSYADSKLSWSAFVAWAEGKLVFVLLPQPRTYFPIPKRAFTADQ